MGANVASTGGTTATMRVRSLQQQLANLQTQHASAKRSFEELASAIDDANALAVALKSGPGQAAVTRAPSLPSCAGETRVLQSARRHFHDEPTLGPNVMLHDGRSMPRVSFGTAHLGTAEEILLPAVDSGYRHFDLAQGYGNFEQDFGRALGHLSRRGLSRGDLFLTSKLTYMTDFGGNRTGTAVRAILKRMRIEYLDMLLLHSWHPKSEKVLEAWRVLESFYDAGLLRGIGLSNVEVPWLQWLLPKIRIKPMVVQNLGTVLWPGHTLLDQPDIFAFCKQNGIVVSSYSVLGPNDETALPAW